MHFGRHRDAVMHRHIDILPLARTVAIDQCCKDRHVSEIARSVPGIAATRGDRNLLRIVCFIVTATAHETAGGQMRQVTALEIAPRPRLAERR